VNPPSKGNQKAAKRFNIANVLWFCGYLIAMTCVVLWMLEKRDEVRLQRADSQALADWQTWRESVREQQLQELPEDRGPVERTVPKSKVPPHFVLLENHFITMLVSALVAGTALFALLVFSVKGTLARVELAGDTEGGGDDDPQNSGTGTNSR